MTFPKACKGIKIIFAAQILSLVSSVLITFFAAFGVIVLSLLDINDDIMIAFIMFLPFVYLLSFLSMLISFVLKGVGVFKAIHDEVNFKVAFYSLIFGILMSVIGIIWSGNTAVSNTVNLLVTLTELLVMVYIMEGIRSLALQLDHPEMDRLGGRLYAIFCVFYVIMTCADIGTLVLNDTELFGIASMLNLFSESLMIVQSILFLFYLNKARKMLSGSAAAEKG